MIRNATLSPTGARAAFEARGEIFSVPTEKGDFRNLTQSSGAHDRSPVWSPDGAHIAWLSDASGEYQLMIGDPLGIAQARLLHCHRPRFSTHQVGRPMAQYDERSSMYITLFRRIALISGILGENGWFRGSIDALKFAICRRVQLAYCDHPLCCFLKIGVRLVNFIFGYKEAKNISFTVNFIRCSRNSMSSFSSATTALPLTC